MVNSGTTLNTNNIPNPNNSITVSAINNAWNTGKWMFSNEPIQMTDVVGNGTYWECKKEKHRVWYDEDRNVFVYAKSRDSIVGEHISLDVLAKKYSLSLHVYTGTI